MSISSAIRFPKPLPRVFSLVAVLLFLMLAVSKGTRFFGHPDTHAYWKQHNVYDIFILIGLFMIFWSGNRKEDRAEKLRRAQCAGTALVWGIVYYIVHKILFLVLSPGSDELSAVSLLNAMLLFYSVLHAFIRREPVEAEAE
jgi:hypothetical protein